MYGICSVLQGLGNCLVHVHFAAGKPGQVEQALKNRTNTIHGEGLGQATIYLAFSKTVF